jgi:hypothetical protein
MGIEARRHLPLALLGARYFKWVICPCPKGSCPPSGAWLRLIKPKGITITILFLCMREGFWVSTE